MDIHRRTIEELEQGEPIASDAPDPVVLDALSGASWRELAKARDDLARARVRSADVAYAGLLGAWGLVAVRTARGSLRGNLFLPPSTSGPIKAKKDPPART